MTLVAALALATAPAAPVIDAAAPAGTEPAPLDEPVTTANEFLPDQRDLTDCVGLVERPGCGSESRGGLHQNLVAIAMVSGLAVIFGRVGWVTWRSSQQRSTADSDDR